LEIFGYPQKQYNPNANYAPFCLMRKKTESRELNALEFKYSQYPPEQVANRERVDSFLSLRLAPLTMAYFQEVTMRLVDYFLVQVVLLLNNPDMITANEDVVQQLVSNSPASLAKVKYFIEEKFEDVVRRFMQPFFMTYRIQFDQPEVVLAPTKEHPHSFLVKAERVVVSTQQLK
jgi:hypothetical protein